jgi:inosine-uridine nucleoside N-ribohydrolase
LLLTPDVGAAQRRVIIDADPGQDDAVAILMAMRSPALRIEAITAVLGNVPLELTLKNALKLTEIGDRTDIPVAAGARSPLTRKAVTATYVHGNDGFGGVVFPEPTVKPLAIPAADLIRQIIRKYPHEVSIIAIGPLTNVATVLRSDPDIVPLIDEVVIMGGALGAGNITPAAEFNVYVDPEAARIVFHSGVKLTMVGMDPVRKGTLSEAQLRMLQASGKPAADAIARILLPTLARNRANGFDRPRSLPDPMAVAAFLDPSLFTMVKMFVDVETSGELTSGMTVAYRVAPLRRSAPSLGEPDRAFMISETFVPNCIAAADVDLERFLKLTMDLLLK